MPRQRVGDGSVARLKSQAQGNERRKKAQESEGTGREREIYKKSVEIKISFVADNEQGARLLESRCFR